MNYPIKNGDYPVGAKGVKMISLERIHMTLAEVKEKHKKYFESVPLGAQCGDGWADIVDRLFTEIDQVEGVTVKLAQLKEKFGLLRIYVDVDVNAGMSMETVDYLRKQIGGLVISAEAESSKVCERCGDSGELRSNRGWVKTLCEAHNS